MILSQECSVDIWTDQHNTYKKLLSKPQALEVGWVALDSKNPKVRCPPSQTQLRILVGTPAAHEIGDVIIEAFGSCPPTDILPELAQRTPPCPWIVIDYLSAESWVQSHHLLASLEPITGIKRLFFYPGFSEKTGGLIREPWLEALTLREKAPKKKPNEGRRLFVFAYSQAPIAQLAQTLSKSDRLDYTGSVVQTSKVLAEVNHMAFVPQSSFDNLLQGYDWLFVRGEDSFVRAQYAGKPFVWNIYPTSDGAHWNKLRAFFNQYAKKLSSSAYDALWQLWMCWNQKMDAVGPFEQTVVKFSQKADASAMTECWQNALCFEQEFRKNAIEWRTYLFLQPDLVKQLCLTIKGEMQS